ncbi:MAG TPA: histidine kinase [Solirubrobacteraceae bacterium]|jgi:signal transduction histidine kinase|nr:histidine kinase [Solirubrobacteraceae bacterium]
MLARLRALDPFKADLLLAAVFFVEANIELAVLVPADAPYRWAAFLLITVAAFSVAVRRRWPSIAALAGVAVQPLAQSLGDAYVDHLVSPFFAILLVLYGIGRHAEGWKVPALTAYSIVMIWISNAIDSYHDTVADYVLVAVLLVGAPVLIGRVLRHRAGLNRALLAKRERLERERVVSAAAAAQEERARIAGELHDVVAHALSAMVVQASGARRLAERDPVRAGDAFLAVERSGREALTEIRGLLGVLRHEDEELALAPQPSLRHVSTLVRKAQAAGLPVHVDVEGEARDLPIGIDLTAYRVIQEALGGALEQGHAGDARVRLRYAADHIEVEVADDGGHAERPLLGIRERVALSGGQLRAGVRRSGGHVVRARLPLGGPA